jgi:hypothetical protein
MRYAPHKPRSAPNKYGAELTPAVDYVHLKDAEAYATAHTAEIVRELVDELVRVRDVMLRECGIGIVNEVILSKYKDQA